MAQVDQSEGDEMCAQEIRVLAVEPDEQSSEFVDPGE